MNLKPKIPVLIAFALVAAAGAVLLSQSLTFGWLKAVRAPTSVGDVHATVIAIAGVAPLLLSVIDGDFSDRIARLKDQAASRRQNEC